MSTDNVEVKSGSIINGVAHIISDWESVDTLADPKTRCASEELGERNLPTPLRKWL